MAVRAVRKARGLPQEAFDQLSSRTYLSAIERGIRQPTVRKVDEFAEVMNVHPLTILALSYKTEGESINSLLSKVFDELHELSLIDHEPAPALVVIQARS